jgi:hypothetical protein
MHTYLKIYARPSLYQTLHIYYLSLQNNSLGTYYFKNKGPTLSNQQCAQTNSLVWGRIQSVLL